MSAAKLAAEARRAKILARASKTTISAVTGDDDDGPILNLDAAVAGAVKERPLAARQATIQAAALKVEEAEKSTTTTPVKDSDSEEVSKSSALPASSAPSSSGASSSSSSSKTNHHDDPEVESIDDMIAKVTAEVNAEKATPPPKKKYVYEKKSLAEIEAEVAQNTAKFDKKVLGKDSDEAVSPAAVAAVADTNSTTPEEDEEKKKQGVSASARKKDGKKTGEKSEVGEKKGKGEKIATKDKVAAISKTVSSHPPKSAVNPQSVVNLFRISLIMGFAILSGYRSVSESVTLSLSQPSSSSSSSAAATTVIYDEFGAIVGEEHIVGNDQDATDPSFMPLSQKKQRPARTWAGWFWSYLECSLSAMMLAHWLAGVVTPTIYSTFGRVENKTSFFSLATVMSIWTNGMDSIYETVYSTIGDFALHIMLLVLSTTMFTILLSENSINWRDSGGFSSSGNAGTLEEL